MTKTLWNPWTFECNELFSTWLRAAKLSGLIAGEFDYEDLFKVVDNAETLDLMEGMPREKAVLLMGLWMGRYQGNQDTGEWRQREFVGSDLENLQLCCREFIEVSDEGTGQELWTSLARLRTAIENIHPENVT